MEHFVRNTIEEYHSGEGISRSLLWKFGQATPLHFKHRKLKPDTQAIRLGTAIDDYITGCDFNKKYGVLPEDYDGRKKEFKLMVEEFHANNQIPIRHEDYLICKSISENLYQNDLMKGLLLGAETQLSIYVNCPIHNVLLKCRPDMYDKDNNVVVDLKLSSRGADLKTFVKSSLEFGYHVQCAMTCDIIKAVTGDYPRFGFAVYENESPFATAFYEMDEEFVEYGRSQYYTLLQKYIRCLETDEWHGYFQDFVPVSLPDWVKR